MASPRVSRLVHVALLFVSHFFLGTFVAVWATYQYEQSRWLASLNQEQGRQLLNLRETLLATETPVRSTPEALVRDLSRLQIARGKAGSVAQPILELRMASDHALLARLYRDGNNGSGAAAESEAARSLLNRLGWREISDATLHQLATRRLQSIAQKEVR